MFRTPVQRHLLGRQQPLESTAHYWPCRKRIAVVVGRRGYATEEGKEERQDFRSQLYHSTNERVERERAEQARFSRLHAAQKGGGRGAPAWLVPFGGVSSLTLKGDGC